MKMHRIHSYPAKFPAFIATKALQLAASEGIKTSKIADIFCGCGTVALEARRSNIHFWGCDINPVATLIARAKSCKYQSGRLLKYSEHIVNSFRSSKHKEPYRAANERLRYWYDSNHYGDLARLKASIEELTPPNSSYRTFFLCAFSNILKGTSRWLTKSIKPQIDPEKKPVSVLHAFKEQSAFMIAANQENDAKGDAAVDIRTANFLDSSLARPLVDMIITSPPYVTSYEYADLHQLSSLWLGYANDYRELREGSVGSLHHDYNFSRSLKHLNDNGSRIVFRLLNKDKSKARSVAKYFLDMQQVASLCHSMLKPKGMSLFVIGNTEYKGVKIENAQHFAESLQRAGFSQIKVTKRKISKKILTPYRNDRGCFTTHSDGRKVYAEEFILIGRK